MIAIPKMRGLVRAADARVGIRGGINVKREGEKRVRNQWSQSLLGVKGESKKEFG